MGGRIIVKTLLFITDLVGATGAQGVQGITGLKGPTGIQGPTGPTGVRGPTGLQGSTGLKGDKGDSFTVDETGAELPTWNDTYANGWSFLNITAGLLYFSNTTTKRWEPPAGIPFGKGDKGDTGPQGPTGIQGIQGAKGEGHVCGSKRGAS